MSIRIDQKKCVGCRKCSEVCPGTLIVMEDKKGRDEISEKLLGLRFLCKGM